MKQLYYNGTIITVNDLQPTAEALLVEDGKLLQWELGRYERFAG